MASKIEFIRKTLARLGWRPEAKEIDTLSGQTLWVVFCKRKGHSFSVQGPTQSDAWESAIGLVDRFQKKRPESRMILPSPTEATVLNKAV
jgi:hypothetical protein